MATRRKKIVLGTFLVGLPALGLGSVELTSGPSFCRTCHEIEPAYESWAQSPHAPAQGKERAGCRDCHVPSWKNPLAVISVKLSRGINDTYHHFASEEERKAKDFYFRIKYRALMDVSDEICLGCHEKVLKPETDKIQSPDGEVRGLHSSAEAKRVKCTVCHKNTGHALYH